MSGKILLLDDDTNILKLLDISLTKAGYDVHTASRAEDALEIANKIEPDLIISDINMPEMDGIEFCWMIRENSKVSLVPIILLTSMKDPDFEIRGYRAGADDYLLKPIDRSVLLHHVQNLINRNQKLKTIDIDTDSGNTPKGFNGDLSELSLVEIIQLLHINKRSGILTVNSAELTFQNGQITRIRYDDLENEDALNKLVKLKDGLFNFTNQETDGPVEITANTMHLVMEACRIMDEGERN